MSTTSAATTPAAEGITTWTLDAAHTQVGFRVRHMMVTWVRGQFGAFEGTVRFDPQHPERTQVEATLQTASVDTGNAQRDEHLRSPDFFDAAGHPAITFRSTGVERTGEDSLKLAGELTIRGTTRPVVLEVTDIGPAAKNPWGQTVRGASATARIQRKDFGLTWNTTLEAGGVLVGEEVQLQLDIQLVQS